MTAPRQPVPRSRIEIRGLRVAFGRTVVLDGLDLDVFDGESLVLIGLSGSGKSVLLRCILGLLRPDAGSIRIDGQDTVGLGERERDALMRRMGVLFQRNALFDSLPVWENVAFGLIEAHHMPRGQAKEVAVAKLASVGLDAAVAELSPPSSRAACRSGWPSRGRSWQVPSSCSSTIPSPGSTPC